MSKLNFLILTRILFNRETLIIKKLPPFILIIKSSEKFYFLNHNIILLSSFYPLSILTRIILKLLYRIFESIFVFLKTFLRYIFIKKLLK